MKTAFKEWAVVCEALASGRQIVILRKGGIVEEGGRFTPDHPEFLLFPTWLHQSPNGVIDEARPALKRLAADPAAETIAMRHRVKVHQAVELRSLDAVRALRPWHIWTDAIVEERFDRWRTSSVYAMVVRVYALPKPAIVPNLPQYGGCKSWVELHEDVCIEGGIPVLDDDEFQQQVKQIESRT